MTDLAHLKFFFLKFKYFCPKRSRISYHRLRKNSEYFHYNLFCPKNISDITSWKKLQKIFPFHFGFEYHILNIKAEAFKSGLLRD